MPKPCLCLILQRFFTKSSQGCKIARVSLLFSVSLQSWPPCQHGSLMIAFSPSVQLPRNPSWNKTILTRNICASSSKISSNVTSSAAAICRYVLMLPRSRPVSSRLQYCPVRVVRSAAFSCVSPNLCRALICCHPKLRLLGWQSFWIFNGIYLKIIDICHKRCIIE